MPREFGRNVRIADAIQRVAAPLVTALAREHRLGMATITGVDVAADLTVAHLFVSVLGAPEGTDAIALLREELPWIRTAVAQELRLKKVPALRISIDGSAARSVRISELLRASKPDA